MFTVNQFLTEGKDIGTGSFKRCYRLGDYVCCVPRKLDDYWGMRAIESQIDVWNEFKDDEIKSILLAPLLDYNCDSKKGIFYYIQPYCSRQFDEDLPLFKVLTAKDVKELVDDTCAHYPVVGDLIRADNQGVLNGMTVIFDWGLTAEDYFQWKLDTCDVELSSFQELGNGELVLFASVDTMTCATIYATDISGSIHLNRLVVDDNFLNTEIENIILDDLFDSYDIIDNREKQDVGYKRVQNIDFKGMSLF